MYFPSGWDRISARTARAHASCLPDSQLMIAGPSASCRVERRSVWLPIRSRRAVSEHRRAQTRSAPYGVQEIGQQAVGGGSGAGALFGDRQRSQGVAEERDRGGGSGDIE